MSNDETSFFADCFEKNTAGEIERYLAFPRASMNLDPIAFWASNRAEYPKLAYLALIVLAIQSTSVASERAFSRAGLIDSDRRSSLSTSSFESLVQLRSWLISNRELNYN